MPRGRPKGSKNRQKLSAYDKNKVKSAREKLQETQCHLFDKSSDTDVSQFVLIKGDSVYIRWDFTRSYLESIGRKITQLLTPAQP